MTGVILMTYGSPKTLEDIPQYLKNIYKDKKMEEGLVEEMQRRYKVIGGSPLVEITQAQAAALEKELNSWIPDQIVGNDNIEVGHYKVIAGFRFAAPFIKDVVEDLSKDCDQILGIIMSPQYSPIIMQGYDRELAEAVENLKISNFKFQIVRDWHLQPNFLKAIAKRVEEALKKMPKDVAKDIPILFTAHSMPKRVIDKEPGYIDDLKETANEVARILKLPKNRWQFCYQSAGHTPEEWLKPDFADLMPELALSGHKAVLIVPVQFLADHLEILYDIEVGARSQAEENGLKFYRVESLNTEPLFIKALADVVRDRNTEAKNK